MTRTVTAVTALAALFVLAAAMRLPQDSDFSGVRIDSQPVAGSVHMLTGSGGNMGLSVGDDGAFLIDDQFAPLAERILAAVAKLTDEPVKFVVNTHWHGDHTGGNEQMGGAGATLVAHDNVRVRMSSPQRMELFGRDVPASPEAALPVITFEHGLTFHHNGDTVDVFHVPGAHTDGDAIIHFQDAGVFHMGDTFFNGMYPFIDTGSGGSIHGVIAAADAVLQRAGDGDRIIPGHGPLSDVEDLRAYRDMLIVARDRIQILIDEGKSREDIVADAPTADLDPTWGGGFMQPDVWVGLVYDGMVDG